MVFQFIDLTNQNLYLNDTLLITCKRLNNHSRSIYTVGVEVTLGSITEMLGWFSTDEAP